MDLSRTLLVFTALVGVGLTALSLLLVPTLFVPVVFPLFKLYGESAAIATALAVTGFLSIQWRAFFRPGWEMLRRFVKYSSPVILNETAWGLGNSMLTVILGYTDNSVEMLAANAVMGNLNRLFLVVCFGLGAATAVIIGKSIG